MFGYFLFDNNFLKRKHNLLRVSYECQHDNTWSTLHWFPLTPEAKWKKRTTSIETKSTLIGSCYIWWKSPSSETQWKKNIWFWGAQTWTTRGPMAGFQLHTHTYYRFFFIVIPAFISSILFSRFFFFYFHWRHSSKKFSSLCLSSLSLSPFFCLFIVLGLYIFFFRFFFFPILKNQFI